MHTPLTFCILHKKIQSHINLYNRKVEGKRKQVKNVYDILLKTEWWSKDLQNPDHPWKQQKYSKTKSILTVLEVYNTNVLKIWGILTQEKQLTLDKNSKLANI